MNILRRRSSLASDFLLFAVLILSSIVLLSIAFWLQEYNAGLRKKHHQLADDSTRVEAALTETIGYIEQYAEFLGEKISHQGEGDLKYIAELMSGRSRESQKSNIYFTTTIDWVTPDEMLRVSSKQGVLKNPYDMSGRDYLARTHVQPWRLQLSMPRLGGLSKQWIIPAGMGIADAQGKFLGSITLGFSLSGLESKISGVLGNVDMRYLILSQDNKLILDSGANNNLGPDPRFEEEAEGNKAFVSEEGYLAAPIKYKGTDFTYYRKVRDYPFVIVSGYQEDMPFMLLSQIVLSRAVGLFALGLAALVVLFLMRHKIVKPIMELARKADLIRAGRQVEIPEYATREINTLGHQLQKIADYIQTVQQVRSELSAKTVLLEHKTEQLEAANKEALVARDAALKANHSKSDFLANMSHELRTPMNAVIGLTNILLMQSFPPERQKEYLQTMQLSAEHLMQLINDLLDFSKLENRQIELENISFGLHEMIEEVVKVQQYRAQEKNIGLNTEIDCLSGVKFLGDPLRLKQVLINLVSNAIKFTNQGSVTIAAECDISPSENCGYLTLAVRDTGIGIPSDKLEAIFTKFSQADTSITRKFGGTGLGLSISKTLVELMGGDIMVESEYGKGSSFITKLRLPIDSGEGQKMLPQATSYEAPKERKSKGSILLAEDSKANILVATTLLESLGYDYTLAYNGLEVLHLIGLHEFDLILMDCQMPEMDGFATTKAIREQESKGGKKRIPIIGLTAFALSGDRKRCLDAGMDDYMSKPIDLDLFAELLERMLQPNPTETTA